METKKSRLTGDFDLWSPIEQSGTKVRREGTTANYSMLNQYFERNSSSPKPEKNNERETAREVVSELHCVIIGMVREGECVCEWFLGIKRGKACA